MLYPERLYKIKISGKMQIHKKEFYSEFYNEMAEQ